MEKIEKVEKDLLNVNKLAQQESGRELLSFTTKFSSDMTREKTAQAHLQPSRPPTDKHWSV